VENFSIEIVFTQVQSEDAPELANESYSNVLNYCQVRILSELINTIKTQKYLLTFSLIIIIIIKSFRIFKLGI
jgi:hypothetical protein